MSSGMHDYTLTIEWRDGATKTTTIRSDDPQRFIRALSADRDVVEAHVDPLGEWDAAFAGQAARPPQVQAKQVVPGQQAEPPQSWARPELSRLTPELSSAAKRRRLGRIVRPRTINYEERHERATEVRAARQAANRGRIAIE